MRRTAKPHDDAVLVVGTSSDLAWHQTAISMLVRELDRNMRSIDHGWITFLKKRNDGMQMPESTYENERTNERIETGLTMRADAVR
jgi:hypothetical protein